jgi:hypothetical protein
MQRITRVIFFSYNNRNDGTIETAPQSRQQNAMQTTISSIHALIETGYKEWPSSIRGTFFIMEFRSRHYVVTARHVVESKGIDTLFIKYRSDSRRSLPLDLVITNKLYDNINSPDYTDVAIYRINNTEVHEGFNFANAVPIDMKSICKDDALIVRGYPSDLQESATDISNELPDIIDAKYNSCTGARGSHEIDLHLTETFPFHDGFCGSPVHLMKNNHFHLLGVIVKIDSAHSKATFIDTSIILQMIEE